MSDKQRIKGMMVGLTLWAILVVFIIIFMSGCGKPKQLIEPGDVVTKTTIDSIVELPQRSTLEFEKQYKYFSDSGVLFTSKKIYKIGDTITFVYKKMR